ncbi:MAG: hypothetical protein IH899_13320, partial [Planctomycetes bacterium]|nr:hypothetical protein [Planctomycetota bacterium]
MSEAEIKQLLEEPNSSAELRFETFQENTTGEGDATADSYPEIAERFGTVGTWRLKAERFWYIFRYYRISQLSMRAVGLVRKRLLKLSSGLNNGYHSALLPELRDNAGIKTLLHTKLKALTDCETLENVERILEGRFRFLNKELSLSDPLNWDLGDVRDCSRLWKFHLHYHECLLDFIAAATETGDDFFIVKAWELVEEWIAANSLDNPKSLETAWHPYCISLRLPIWILLWKASAPANELREKVLFSLLAQAQFLERHLEWDLRGNHLLENVRALTFVGSFFQGRQANRWLRKSEQILQREIPDQILPHGEHFERSPMYHVRMLEVLNDVRSVTEHIRPRLSDLCGNATDRMRNFLNDILHPDGEIPLFADSSFRETSTTATSARVLTKECDNITSNLDNNGLAISTDYSAKVVGDYWIWKNQRDFLIFDAG